MSVAVCVCVCVTINTMKKNQAVLFSILAAAFATTSAFADPTDDDKENTCTEQHHRGTLFGTQSWWCLCGIHDRWVEERTEVSERIEFTSLVASPSTPAVCLAQIPETWRNDSPVTTITNSTTWKVYVNGNVQYSQKYNLGFELAFKLGVDLGAAVTVGAGVEWSYTHSVADAFTVNQQDCHNVKYDLKRVRISVQGGIRATSRMRWLSCADHGTNLYGCQSGDIYTSCDLGYVATGNGSYVRQTIIEGPFITPCCPGLIEDYCRHPQPELPGTCCCRKQH